MVRKSEGHGSREAALRGSEGVGCPPNLTNKMRLCPMFILQRFNLILL